jgi:hypothetical protein
VTHGYRVKLTHDKDLIEYSVGLSPGTPATVQGSQHAADALIAGPWNGERYTTLRDRVAEALLKIEIPSGSYIPDLGIRIPAKGNTSWIEVFLLIDAVWRMKQLSQRQLGVYVYPYDQQAEEPEFRLTEPG